MIGMNVGTGRALSGVAHLKQSIRDILTTPLGSRVMRRDYGSRLFELIDRPITSGWLVEVYAATAEALDRWEPRFKLTRVQALSMGEGSVVIEIEGRYLPDGSEIKLEGIEI